MLKKKLLLPEIKIQTITFYQGILPHITILIYTIILSLNPALLETGLKSYSKG